MSPADLDSRILRTMPMYTRPYAAVVLAVFLMLAGSNAAVAQSTDPILDGSFWKDQGLTNVLPAWVENAQTKEGLFFAELDQKWTPEDSTTQYPGMLARHIFSLSAAYLMDGDESHLRNASRALDFLIEHGWDEKHGGWYNAVTRSGEIVDPKKSLFMQIYATTGLALYTIATKDPRARTYLERSRSFVEEHAWDQEYGGYVDALARDGTVQADHKDFSPQLAPLSGYLLYLYPATRDSSVLRKAERIMDLTLTHMQNDEGWILERFARDWTFLPGESKNDQINVGHNLEVAWLLLRLHALTGDERYRREGLALTDQLLEKAFHEDTGAWRGDLNRKDPAEHSSTTTWWAHAYGNMLQLYAYRVTGKERYLDAFREGARFWNEHFIDQEYGGSPTRARLEGGTADGAKGKRTKTSYHSLEHSFLLYLYLDLWVNDESVSLHYRMAEPAGERLYPLPIEDLTPQVNRVTIDGTTQTPPESGPGWVPLPETGPVEVNVKLRSSPSRR